MQTVAAQWVMLSLTSSATLVASIGAAASLPVLLLGILAGALGDLIDRKRLITGSQLLMLLASAGLAGAAAAHGLTPETRLLATPANPHHYATIRMVDPLLTFMSLAATPEEASMVVPVRPSRLAAILRPSTGSLLPT
jgi:MFS family permease